MLNLSYMTHKIPAFVILIIYFMFTNDAFAYIDPGSGSMALQVIIAAILGAVTAIKIYWNKIKNLFSKKTETTKKED